MKKFIALGALIALFSACSPQANTDTKTLSYSTSGKYIILVQPGGKGVNIHKQAMKQAVKLTRLNGFRYFKIVNRGEVGVLQNGKVMEQSFVNQNLKEGYFKEGDVKAAYRMTIRCYRTRPFFGQVIDTCRYGRWFKLKR